MNARSQVFELTVESKQLEEVVNSIFHTILFHRTTGKIHYKQEGAFVIGTVCVVETDCDFVDMTYVRCNSPTLDKNLRREVSAFKDALRSTDVNAGLQSGQINHTSVDKSSSGDNLHL
ncbi:autophagy-related protein 101-like [Apostichopus japonicus]|uniref:autophagy-related protein 101-like n=1 Tax=Stichopus japonicus TaxID=307972 RepID=UPI003AB2832D